MVRAILCTTYAIKQNRMNRWYFTLYALKEKHPKAACNPQTRMLCCLQGEIPSIHPILFDCINASVVHKIALTIQGAAGPSMADSFVWRRMLVRHLKRPPPSCVLRWLI